MARYGFSPATRVFEAAGAGACLITDAWEGVEQFFEPGGEMLVAHDGAEVAELLRGLDAERARRSAGGLPPRARRAHLRAPRRARWKQALEGAVCGMKIVILGLSITSSWGNGHATTYRGLLRELQRARA